MRSPLHHDPRWFLPLLLACADPPKTSGPAVCTIDPPAIGALHTSGPEIRDQHNRIALLRGVNAGGRSKFAPYSPFDYTEGNFEAALDAYLDLAAALGVGTLRVPFTWAALEPTQGTWDEAWLGRYDALLDGAAARDIWTIVDFHQDVYGEFYCGDGFPAWTVEDAGPPRHDCPDWFTGYLNDELVIDAFDALWDDRRGTRTAAREMWSFMAAHHAGRPGVIGFELLNEPWHGTVDPTRWGRETLPAFYAELGDAVRAEAPDALLLYDASGVDAVTVSTEILPPPGENWVFAPHWYDAAVLAGVPPENADPDAAFAEWRAVGDTLGVPVLIGEFGVDPALDGAEAYAEAQWRALDQHGLSGTWWEYSTGAELWNDEQLSIADPSGEPYPEVAVPLARPTPRLIAGESPEWTWEEGRFTLRFEAAAAGVTEVLLPSWGAGFSGATLSLSQGCVDVRSDRVYVQAGEDGPLELVIVR